MRTLSRQRYAEQMSQAGVPEMGVRKALHGNIRSMESEPTAVQEVE